MAIAILGWGSLIWSPGCLRLKTLWHDDGPQLPIEFARKSRDKRLTLVISEKASPIRVYWALSEFDDPANAKENLGEREGSGKRGIQSTSDKPPLNQGITDVVSAWMRSRKSITEVLWTALGASDDWRGLAPAELTKHALRYLADLKKNDRVAYGRAKEYVRNAPWQVQTCVRAELKKADPVEWRDNPLSKTLFRTPGPCFCVN